MKKLSLGNAALKCLIACDPEEKIKATHNVVQLWKAECLEVNFTINCLPNIPGRPMRPTLVAPRKLSTRKLTSAAGRAALIHAITHIEFNAINLAWDAVCRFHGLPKAFYDNWIQIASEEAYHFCLLDTYLHSLGYKYGDFPAHNGLWEMAQKTAHDPLVRMALVPRVLEARGLDVTPGMVDRLQQAGDLQAVAILKIIFRDEVGHVAIGSHWFHYLCKIRGLDPETTFCHLVTRYFKGKAHSSLHRQARLEAGFSESELHMLENIK
ncbi:ferritin-like domain-containing protein [Candidatus Nitrosoglobus terrae]|nr:ferritin-like domain-containing protein [Candidatus Nitrosoglobus terrae]